jgi:hypothetical protein
MYLQAVGSEGLDGMHVAQDRDIHEHGNFVILQVA